MHALLSNWTTHPPVPSIPWLQRPSVHEMMTTKEHAQNLKPFGDDVQDDIQDDVQFKDDQRKTMICIDG